MVWIIILLVLGLLGYGFYKMFFSEEAKAKEAAAEKQRQEKRNQQIVHYSSQPLIISVANRISADINNSITNANRQAHIQNITVTYKYSVFDDCITNANYDSDYSKGSTFVDFEHARIENLDWSEKEFVGIAIFRLVENNIKSKFPKDPGGLDYSIRYSLSTHKVQVGRGKYNEKTREWVYSYDYGKKFQITYSCQNGCYRSKTRL